MSRDRDIYFQRLDQFELPIFHCDDACPLIIKEIHVSKTRQVAIEALIVTDIYIYIYILKDPTVYLIHNIDPPYILCHLENFVYIYIYTHIQIDSYMLHSHQRAQTVLNYFLNYSMPHMLHSTLT